MSDWSTSWLTQVKFSLLLTFSIPSVICSILILVHFYQQRNTLSIHHHLTILLTILSIIQVTTQPPLAMTYYRQGKVIPATNSFCIWWTWWEYSLNGVSRFIMVWGSIERHFLVFHNSLMATKIKRLIFHILPALITIIFPLLFYFAALVLNSCEHRWNFNTILCGAPCYITSRSDLFIYDTIGTMVIPVLIIFFANLCLVFRVVIQKRQHHTAWHRHRKLTIQLLGVAFLYILFWFPLAFNSFMLIFRWSIFTQQLQINYFIYLVYMVPIFLPFILLTSIPELRNKICNKRRRTVRPILNTNL